MRKVGFYKRHWIRITLSLGFVLLLLLHAMGRPNLDFVQRLENYTYDLRLTSTAPHTPDPRIVIVDIDEKSLQEQGHWPWPRNKLAHLVDLLFDKYEIDVLGFDMLFAERDESSGLMVMEALASGELRGDASFKVALDRLKPQLNYDQLFADSLKDRRVVLGYYFRHEEKQSEGVGKLPPPALAQGSFEPSNVDAIVAGGFAGNLPELQTSAAAGGYITTQLVDADGVYRRIPLLQMYEGALYETLALAVARLNLREPKVELDYAQGDKSEESVEYLKLGKRWIPVDHHVAALIPFRGKQGSFVYVSASDVLQDKVPPETLRKTIVLIGSTASGLKDLRSTPMQEVYAGVEMHANLIAGIVDSNIKERSPTADKFEFESLLAIGLLLAFALPILSPIWATLLSGSVMAGFAGFNLFLWKSENQVLPLASTLLLITVLFVFNMAYGFFIESRGKRLLTSLFGQYVPPELVDEMAKDPGAYSLAGESRELTVLFSDVRGFTTISEGLDPTQLTHFINEFLTPMTQVIQRHRGTIDKYMGDAIMAFWGAPMPDQQHARHALLAALDMITSLEVLQTQFKARGWPPIEIGVGLNTGAMTVGNMGSEFRLAYTVMGDAVNLGSRLESLTREYGVPIIVSEYTRAAAPDFVYRELDRVRVKGKDKAVVILQPICPVGQEDATITEELLLYGVALRAYREQNWQMAEEKFAELHVLYPDRWLYQMYAKRIAYLRAHPPDASWDGVFIFTTK